MTTPAHIYKTARRQIRKIRHRGPRNDKESALLASADQQRVNGLGWRYDGFEGVSSEVMFAQLNQFGIDVTQDGFRDQALSAGSPTKLAEAWGLESKAEGRWCDYPNLAARELWSRLLPDEIRGEVVSDQVDGLLELAEVASPEKRVEMWRQAAAILVKACLVDGLPNQELFREVLREAGCDLTGWMTQMPLALLGTTFEREAPDRCRDFAHFTDGPALLALRAELLLQAGKPQEAVCEIETLLRDHPTDSAVLLKAGGIYETLGNVEASQKYLGAYMAQREADRRAAQAKVDAMNRQNSDASKGGLLIDPRLIKTPPNALCPCGSGKKFKRCHGSKH